MFYSLILKDGTYASGDFKPEGSIEVPIRPKDAAIWKNNKWTFPDDLAISDLRYERNLRLAETDWWAGSDLTMSAEQIAYRQALRDLPSTSSPELDEYGEVTGVDWPTKPE